MNIDNLDGWFKYLDSLPYGLSHKSLDHLKKIATELGVQNFSSRIITVAGTNGKGSTVIFLESILLAAGFKTCAYISPHLSRYEERIRLDGIVVDENVLCWAFALVESIRVQTNIILSYFEFSTLTALVIFKKYQPDFIVLEVGLGGKFDAVNLIDSDIAIISTISLDHTKVLGDTRDAIAKEKAGIMRPFKPVICGIDMPHSIYEKASETKSVLYCLNQDFTYIEKENYWDWRFGTEVLANLPFPQLPIADAALALMAIKILSSNFKILPSAIVSGLKNAFLPARFQKITAFGRKIILDVAHNFESATLLAANLVRNKTVGRILGVASMLKDKDIVAIMQPLVPIVDKWYVGIINNARAASERQLLTSLQETGIKNFSLLPTIKLSLQQAIAECLEKDKIVIFGSFYTVAEAIIVINNWR